MSAISQNTQTTKIPVKYTTKKVFCQIKGGIEMEENRLHFSVEVKNFEEVCSKVQQIKKLINELNDIKLDIELVPNEIKNLEEMAKKIAKKQA